MRTSKPTWPSCMSTWACRHGLNNSLTRTNHQRRSTMSTFKRTMIGVAVAAALSLGTAQAQVTDGVIKIGVLTDMSSLYTDLAGAGSVAAAKMAIADFNAASKGMKVEMIA